MTPGSDDANFSTWIFSLKSEITPQIYALIFKRYGLGNELFQKCWRHWGQVIIPYYFKKNFHYNTKINLKIAILRKILIHQLFLYLRELLHYLLRCQHILFFVKSTYLIIVTTIFKNWKKFYYRENVCFHGRFSVI